MSIAKNIKAQKKVAVKVETPVEPTPVPEPVVDIQEQTPEEEAPVVVEGPSNSLEDQLNYLKNTIHDISKTFETKLKELKVVETSLSKLVSAVKKIEKKKSRGSTPKDPKKSEHGFNAKVAISAKLAEFLGVEADAKFSRPQITSLISKYANDNGLKDPSNKGILLPDKKLSKLLGPAVHPLKKGHESLGYGFFNLQIYLKEHFIK